MIIMIFKKQLFCSCYNIRFEPELGVIFFFATIEINQLDKIQDIQFRTRFAPKEKYVSD